MENLKNFIKNADLNNQAIYFSDPYDCYYLTGFNSSNAHIFYYNKQWFYLTDDRYFSAAQKKIKSYAVFNVKDKPLNNIIIPLLKKQKASLLVNRSQITLIFYQTLKGILSKEKIVLKDIPFPNIRAVKSEQEIKIMKEALKLTENILEKVRKNIKVGVSEKEIERLLLKEIFSSEADDKSFTPIVAAGVNSANPHWESSDYKIKTGDFVLIDFGLKYKQYCSDISRTFVVGNPSSEKIEIYTCVKNAVNLAVMEIKPGLKAGDIDSRVRKFFASENMEKYFTHALGHSLGLEIHESPNFSPGDETILKPGMILTVEPGLYIADMHGVRIEQEILVTKNGCEVLNHSSIELLNIK